MILYFNKRIQRDSIIRPTSSQTLIKSQESNQKSTKSPISILYTLGDKPGGKWSEITSSCAPNVQPPVNSLTDALFTYYRPAWFRFSRLLTSLLLGLTAQFMSLALTLPSLAHYLNAPRFLFLPDLCCETCCGVTSHITPWTFHSPFTIFGLGKRKLTKYLKR